MMNHFVYLVFDFTHCAMVGDFLCAVSLRGLWIPAKLYLLHNLVITLVLKSLIWVVLI